MDDASKIAAAILAAAESHAYWTCNPPKEGAQTSIRGGLMMAYRGFLAEITRGDAKDKS
jgi:hypothetical protein